MRNSGAAAIALAASLIVMSYPLVGNVDAAGFGATCLNRHDASFQSVLIHSPATNYTGTGSEILAAWIWGYDVTVVLTVNTAIMMNAQADTTNGSVFFANDVYGMWYPHCYYNIGPDVISGYFQFHPANLTGYERSHQTVSFSTGTHNGQYV